MHEHGTKDIDNEDKEQRRKGVTLPKTSFIHDIPVGGTIQDNRGL